MRTKIVLIIFMISFGAASYAMAQTGQDPKYSRMDSLDQNGFLKGSEVHLSFLKRVGGEKYFTDTFANKEVDPRIRFSIWRSNKKNVVMNFGTQSLIAPNLTSNILVSLVSFEIGFDYCQKLGNSDRYKVCGFLTHRSQHIFDLLRLGIEIPESVNNDLNKNVFSDLNILGVVIERFPLSGDKLQYNYRAYIQPYNSSTLRLWKANEVNKYERPLFVDGEVFLPLSFARNHLSIYGSGELGRSSSLGTPEARLHPIENLVVFARQSFISGDHEAVVTPHSGVVYRGFKIGFFIKVGNLFN